MQNKLLKLNLNQIIIMLYLFFVLESQLFLYLRFHLFLLTVPLIAFICYICTRCLYSFINKFFINCKPYKSNIIVFFIIFITIFAISFILCNISYKLFDDSLALSSFPADFQVAYNDALYNTYNEWHSVLFVLLFFKLPMIVFGESILFIFIFYVFIRSLIIAFVIYNIYYEFHYTVLPLLLIVFYTATPLSVHSDISCLKDTPCALFALLSLYFAYERYKFKDQKKSIFYDIMFVLALFFCNSFRHNAIVFVIPLLLIHILYNLKSSKKVIISAILFLMCLFAYRGVLYKCLNVSPIPKERITLETMGMPISVLCCLAKYKPEVLNEKEYDYVYTLSGGDLKNYQLYDEKQGYDSVKYDVPVFNENKENAIKEWTQIDFLKSMFSLIVREPILTIKQIINLTCGVYARRYRTGSDSATGIRYLFFLFANMEIPVLMMMFILIIFSKNHLSFLHNFDFAISIPILIYVFVTMCLLSSNGIHRYFLPFQMSFPLYFISNLKK